MLTTRYRPRGLEMLRWLAVIALAILLAVMLVKQASGKEAIQNGPKSLPTAIAEWAQRSAV